jgi:hypothetical protein
MFPKKAQNKALPGIGYRVLQSPFKYPLSNNSSHKELAMDSAIITKVLQIIVALGLLNVLLVRRNKSTSYRGGNASNIVEEFAVYGFSRSFCYAIGTLKVSAAIALLLGLQFPALVIPASALIAALMLGAVSMHAKVQDPISKALPASLMLAMSATVFFASWCC